MRRTDANIARDIERLKGVHPDLQRDVLLILSAMDLLGYAMMVTEGVRTRERQYELWSQGRVTPGKIVTNCDGQLKKSNHQVKDDGYGHAVDLCFVDDPATSTVESYDDHQPWDLMGLMAEKLGLRWGGRWTMRDLPHVELNA